MWEAFFEESLKKRKKVLLIFIYFCIYEKSDLFNFIFIFVFMKNQI